MQETKSSSWYSTVAGALFAFGGVMQIVQWGGVCFGLGIWPAGYNVQMLIRVASYAVLAFALLTKRRDIFLPVGFALAGIAYLFHMSFASVLLLLGNWGMAFLAVVFVTDYLTQLREQVKKFWFIPSCGRCACHGAADWRHLVWRRLPGTACYMRRMRRYVPGSHVGRLPRRTPPADGKRIRRNRKLSGHGRF